VTETRQGDIPAQIAVIVTHYKSLPALRASLTSVRDFADLRRTEVIVADSEVQPGTAEEIADLLPGARHIAFADDVGYAVSVGAALEATKAPHVLVLNADVRISPGMIDTLVEALERSPQLGIVAPVLRYDDESLQDSAFRFYRPLSVLHRRSMTGRTRWGRAALRRFTEPSREVERAMARGDSTPVETDWVLGAAIMVRRAAIEEVGPPDTRYWMYFEDVDWCLRMWHAGWRVAVVPSATAHHAYGRASRVKGPLALWKSEMARVHLRSGIKFFRTHGLRPTRSKRSVAAESSASAAATTDVHARPTP
jgi:GT2 family glycosyltransferase